MAYLGTFSLGIFLMIFEVVFIHVYKRYGSIVIDLDPRSKILGKTSWIQGLDPRSKIQDSRPWIQEVFPSILDLGSLIQINCYGSIVFINVYKRRLHLPKPRCPEKGFREGPKYWKIQINPDPSHVWTTHLLSKLRRTFSRVNFQDFCNISLNWILLSNSLMIFHLFFWFWLVYLRCLNHP